MVTKTPIWHSTAGHGPPVVLLHGLFGAGGNLGKLSRSLAGRYAVYSLDLPNHGRSAWMEDATPARMAAAVSDWLCEQGLQRAAFVGHSLGGKVAMQLALASPQAVSALVVVDIAPVDYPPGHDAVFTALEAVAGARCRSRDEAAGIMRRDLEDEGVVQFLLMSLRRGEDGVYDWRFNLRGLRRDYAAVGAAPAARGPFTGPALFVRGGESDYILPVHRPALQALFPAAELEVIPGCGHWPHVERPAEFNGIVGRFLDRHTGAAAAAAGQ